MTRLAEFAVSIIPTEAAITSCEITAKGIETSKTLLEARKGKLGASKAQFVASIELIEVKTEVFGPSKDLLKMTNEGIVISIAAIAAGKCRRLWMEPDNSLTHWEDSLRCQRFPRASAAGTPKPVTKSELREEHELES